MAAQDDIPDEAESKANETDDDVMLDAKEQLDDDLGNLNFLKKALFNSCKKFATLIANDLCIFSLQISQI